MEAASCYGKLAVAKGVIANLHQLLAKAKLDIQHLQERLATNESVVWSQEVQPTAHLAGIHNFIALLFACMAACWLYSGTHAFLIDQHATAMARRLLSGGDGTGGELYHHSHLSLNISTLTRCMKIDPSAPVSMTPRVLILSDFACLESFSHSHLIGTSV